jgi:hypothetical protein
MAEKLYRPLALAVAGMFYLLQSSTIQANTAPIKTKLPQSVQSTAIAPRPQTGTPQKRRGSKAFIKKKDPRRSAFVTRCSFILDKASPVKDYLQREMKPFNAPFVGLLRGVRGLEWINGSISAKTRGGSGKKNFIVSNYNMSDAAFLYLPSLAATEDDFAFDEFFDAMYPYALTLIACTIDYKTDTTLDLFGSNTLQKESDFGRFQDTLFNAADNDSSSPFTYQYQVDTMSLNAGISWKNDLGGTTETDTAREPWGLGSTSDKISGLNFNLGANYQAFSLTGGYIRAFDPFALTDLSLEENTAEPSAWTGELAYTTKLLHKETVLALEYQRNSEALKTYLPEERYTTKASMLFLDGTMLSLEYYIDKDFSEEDGVSGDAGYGITTRVGFEF